MDYKYMHVHVHVHTYMYIHTYLCRLHPYFWNIKTSEVSWYPPPGCALIDSCVVILYMTMYMYVIIICKINI